MGNSMVSVIIPVFKVEKYLNQCVDSVLNQSYGKIEIILVDDGSPDECPNICEQYAKKDFRVKTFHKDNGGLSSARNYGLKKASGEYILFLDSDDYLDSIHAIETMIKKINGCDILMYRYKRFIEKSGNMINTLPEVNIPKFMNKVQFLGFLVDHGLFLASACNKFIRREFLINNNIFFQEGVTSEDIEWCGLLMLKSKSITYINEDFYVYREREGSITASMSENNIKDLKNNIVQSIENCQKILKAEDELYAVYMSFMAYQYATLILCAHNVKDRDMYHEVLDMKKYIRILSYSNNQKVKMFRMIYKLFGFKALYFAAGIYMKYIYNKAV